MEKALGIKYGTCKDYELVEGKDYTVGGVSGSGWGFQDGEKNPRWSGGPEAYRIRRGIRRRGPDKEKETLRMADWREKNREHYNAYMREYNARRKVAG